MTDFSSYWEMNDGIQCHGYNFRILQCFLYFKIIQSAVNQRRAKCSEYLPFLKLRSIHFQVNYSVCFPGFLS